MASPSGCADRLRDDPAVEAASAIDRSSPVVGSRVPWLTPIAVASIPAMMVFAVAAGQYLMALVFGLD